MGALLHYLYIRISMEEGKGREVQKKGGICPKSLMLDLQILMLQNVSITEKGRVAS